MRTKHAQTRDHEAKGNVSILNTDGARRKHTLPIDEEVKGGVSTANTDEGG